MPATRRTASEETRPTSPYNLDGTSKAQLSALTIAALKSHLKHFKLQTAGNKAALVDRLHSHLQADATNGTQGDATNNQQTATTRNPQQGPPLQQENGTPMLPQQILNQLTTILQQAQNPQPTSAGDMNATTTILDTTEDDRLSAASVPVQPNNLASSQAAATRTLVQPVNPSTLTTVLPSSPTPSLPQPALPPTPARIQEKIAKGEYIDFIALLPKSMFGAPEPQSQTLTLQLNQSGDNFSIQSPTSSRKTTSFSAWMEAWNVYLAHRISLNPSCAPYLIAYQRIITSASTSHPLQAWVSYDVKFRTKAASDPSLRWDIQDLDLWLEHFPGTAAQSSHWPCNHCGSTTHYPSHCPFVPLLHTLMEDYQLMEKDHQLLPTLNNDLPQHMSRLQQVQLYPCKL